MNDIIQIHVFENNFFSWNPFSAYYRKSNLNVITTKQNRLTNYYYSIVESINNNLYFNSKHFFIVKLHHYYNYCYNYSVRRDNIFIIQNTLYETKNIINLVVWICHYQESDTNIAMPKTELCVAKCTFYILLIWIKYLLSLLFTKKWDPEKLY